MPKIIDFDDIKTNLELDWSKWEDWIITDKDWNRYNENWELLDEDWEIDIRSQVLQEMKDELSEQLKKAEKERISHIEEEQKKKQEEEKENKKNEEFIWNSNDSTFWDDNDFFWWEEDEEEKVKRIFIHEIQKYKSNFIEWFNWIDFSYKNIDSLLIESISVKELSSEEELFDDTIWFKHSIKMKLFRIPNWESEYDYLSSMKWNKFIFYKEADVLEKDCDNCFWTWHTVCKNCRWDKEITCRVCLWECTVQERMIEKKLIDKWNCPVCWWTKNKICWVCRWQWFLLWPCWNCRWQWRQQDWSTCRVCNWQWQIKSQCWSCSWWWKIHCNECNSEWRFLIYENVESFKTVKCKECDWKWKKICWYCHWEWELRCEKCDWEAKINTVKKYSKEFEINRKRELFKWDDSFISNEEIKFIKDMNWNQVRLPLDDYFINVYLKDWWKERFNSFVTKHKELESKKKTIYWKQISFILWNYSYQWKIYRLFIQNWKVFNIELPESSSWKIIKNIVSAWFIAKWVLWNIFWKKSDLQKDLEDLNDLERK